jgi:hypothetical protein
VDLEFAYTLSAQAKLVLTAHEVYLPKPKLAVEGPGGVQASFDFRGAKNNVAGRMLTVTLTNDLDGAVTHDAQRSPQACPQFGGCSRMIDLAQRLEPYEIVLPYGLTATVKPLTNAGMAAAQAAARRAIEAIERQGRERTEAGLALDGLPDLSTEGERGGFYQAQLIRELAVRHVVS